MGSLRLKGFASLFLEQPLLYIVLSCFGHLAGYAIIVTKPNSAEKAVVEE